MHQLPFGLYFNSGLFVHSCLLLFAKKEPKLTLTFKDLLHHGSANCIDFDSYSRSSCKDSQGGDGQVAGLVWVLPCFLCNDLLKKIEIELVFICLPRKFRKVTAFKVFDFATFVFDLGFRRYCLDDSDIRRMSLFLSGSLRKFVRQAQPTWSWVCSGQQALWQIKSLVTCLACCDSGQWSWLMVLAAASSADEIVGSPSAALRSPLMGSRSDPFV